MDNIFDKIVKTIPAPAAKQDAAQQPDQSAVDISGMDTKKLIARWQKDNNPAGAEELLKRMAPTMSSAINSYAAGTGNKLEIKAANLTLNALRKYKPEYGTDPGTFVFHNLKRLSRYSGQQSNIIPVSERMQQEQKMVRNLMQRFEDDNGREPSIPELADITGLSVKKLEKLTSGNAVVNDTSTLSEDTKMSGVTFKDVTDKDYFEYVYASVGPLDQKIMDWTAGAHGKPVLAGNQIAAKLGITPAAVSQHKAKIQDMLSDIRGAL